MINLDKKPDMQQMPEDGGFFRMSGGGVQGEGGQGRSSGHETCQWEGREGGHEEPVFNTRKFASHNFVSGSFEGGLPGNGTVSLECREDPVGLRASCRDVQARHEKARMR